MPTRRPRLIRALVRLLPAVAILAAIAGTARAQNEPYPVYDTRSVVVHGPYLVEPGETAVTIVWLTDTPAQGKVRYGETDALGREAEPAEHGFVPVGTLHHVRLTGLRPGRTYRYRVVSRRVVRLRAYWPEMGVVDESPLYTFTTLDRAKPAASFSAITDTHEDTARIRALAKLVDWPATDFFAHLGDGVDWLAGEDQMFDRWLDPLTAALGHTTPLVYARGNHEMRGPFARELFRYLPVSTGEYYYAFDDGPAHVVVLDSGEDKADATNVYAGLNRVEPYRERELAWWRAHVAAEPRARTAPFQIVLVHQPGWGFVGGGRAGDWTAAANAAGVDLVLAGHLHRYRHVLPGTSGNDYHVVALGQDQVARVDVSATALKVEIRGRDGQVVDVFTLPRRAR
jgi:predicted phosphodiesterase